MPSITVENYLKKIYLEQQTAPEGLVPMGRLASAMGVVPGTATSMIKALADSGLVTYEPRLGTRLTRGGEQLALHVLRRHRLLELFLVKVLGLDWTEVHAEAEELEHAVSEKVLARMDDLLGHPSVDPHGDPIPSPRGKLPLQAPMTLSQAPLGVRLRVARVSDQEPGFLQFVDRSGLRPGAVLQIESRQNEADAIMIRVEAGQSLALGPMAAAKILVEPA